MKRNVLSLHNKKIFITYPIRLGKTENGVPGGHCKIIQRPLARRGPRTRKPWQLVLCLTEPIGRKLNTNLELIR